MADLREQLAALAHEQWSGWMRYLFKKSAVVAGGDEGPTVRIPAWAVERWGRQMRTPYAELSEREKESDRKEADRVLALLAEEDDETDAANQLLAQLRQEAAAALAEHERLKAELRLEKLSAAAVVTAVLFEIGGEVEGKPTSRLNYLQRLRELVRLEATRYEHDAEMEHHADAVVARAENAEAQAAAMRAALEAEERMSRGFTDVEELKRARLHANALRAAALATDAGKPDFVDEVVAERTAKNPGFPGMVRRAEDLRLAERVRAACVAEGKAFCSKPVAWKARSVIEAIEQLDLSKLVEGG